MVDVSRTIAQLISISADNTTGNYTNQNMRDVIVTMQSRTPQLRSTDSEFGAIGDGSSHPLSGIAAFAAATSPAGLAAIVVPGGSTPYSWATNSIYGLTFTKVTSAATASGSTLSFGTTTVGMAGDLQNPAQYLVVGMVVTGTNIPANTTISTITFTSGTPNAIDGPLAGTITLSAAVTGGGVASGATITFTYSSTLMQALEMDWVGIQACEFACGLPTLGARHYTPAGSYIMNRTLIRSDTPVSQYMTHQSSWTGDGMVNTRLTWPTDLGWGTWAVTCADRFNPAILAFSDMRDIGVFGPGNGTTMGVAGCKMQGLATSTDFFAFRVSCQSFYAGVNIINDHQQFVACFFQNNFYNVYFAPYASQNTGDQSFIDCFMDGPTWASVAVAGTNQIVAAHFERCHMGFGPYCFYKEAGATTNFLINSLFIRVSMEAFGNGAIYDSNSTGLIAGCSFINHDMALDINNIYEIASRTTFAAIYCANMNNCQFSGEADPYTAGYNRTTRPYTLGVIASQAGITTTSFGNAGNLVAVGTTAFPAVQAAFGMDGTATWSWGALCGSWRTSSGAITAGNFVSMTNFGFAIAPSATNPAIIGMAYYGASGSPPAGFCIAVVERGGVATANKHTSTDVLAAGTYVQIFSNTVGNIVAFNSGARTSTVGIVWNATTSGQTTVAIQVLLTGP